MQRSSQARRKSSGDRHVGDEDDRHVGDKEAADQNDQDSEEEEDANKKATKRNGDEDLFSEYFDGPRQDKFKNNIYI